MSRQRTPVSRSVSPVSSLGHSDQEARKKTNVHTGEVDEDEDDHGIDWQPGWRHRFPWTGFAGLVTIVVATAMAVAILGISHHKRVDDWPFEKYPIQPNVLLNIANQVQNLGLLTMIAQGLAIAWWRSALKGSSLNRLHRNHAYSYSFYAILTSGRHFNLVALAALMTKFAVIDSTLFQKATKTTVTQQSAYMNSSVTAWIATEWPQNSGGIPGRDSTIKTIDVNWAHVIDAYNGKVANGKVHENLEEKASFFGCPFRQECSGKLQALGFAYDCETTREDIDYGLARINEQGNSDFSYPLWNVNFQPRWVSENQSYASVQLDMLYADTHRGDQPGSCPGYVTKRTCEIRPAIIEYPVTVMIPSQEELRGKNIVTHIKFFNQSTTASPFGAALPDKQIDGLKVLSYTYLDEHLGNVSTVGALTYVLNNLYKSSAHLIFDSEWDIKVQGSQAQSIFYADSDSDDSNMDRCYYDIDASGRDDPAMALLRKINTLSFVAGLYLNNAPNLNVTDRPAKNLPSQTILTSVTGIVEEYVTNFDYMAGALVATFVTVLLVLPVYWGFWQLGRKVTLGPLEITQAFGAPIVAPDRYKGAHGDFDHILREVGKRKVQYGQLKGAPAGQMGIAEPRDVQFPDKVVRAGGTTSGRVMGVGVGAVLGGITAGLVGGNAKS